MCPYPGNRRARQSVPVGRLLSFAGVGGWVVGGIADGGIPPDGVTPQLVGEIGGALFTLAPYQGGHRTPAEFPWKEGGIET